MTKPLIIAHCITALIYSGFGLIFIFPNLTNIADWIAILGPVGGLMDNIAFFAAILALLVAICIPIKILKIPAIILSSLHLFYIPLGSILGILTIIHVTDLHASQPKKK